MLNRMTDLEREAFKLFEDVPPTEEYYRAPDIKRLYDDPGFVLDCLKSQIVEDLLQAMEEQEINRTVLAQKLGKKKQYVSRILNETANFTLRSMVNISHALGKRLVVKIVDPVEGEVLHSSSGGCSLNVDFPSQLRRKEQKHRKDLISCLTPENKEIKLEEVTNATDLAA